MVGRYGLSFRFLSIITILLQSTGAYAQLHVVYEGVGAGAITVPPIEIPFREKGILQPAVVLATEDRRLRLLDSNGIVIGEYRTGIRYPLSVAVVRRAPSGADPQRTGSGSSALLRTIAHDGSFAVTSVYGGRLRGTSIFPPRPPLRHSGGRRGFDESVVAAHVDPTGNTLVFSSPAIVSYISASGYLLWSRSLPAAVTSTVSDESGVYAGLADGRVFAFSRHGDGRLVVRLEAAVSDIAIASDRDDPFVIVLTNDGRVFRLDDERSDLSVRWSTDLQPRIDGGDGTFVRPDRSGRIAVFRRRGAMVSLDPEGTKGWVVDIPGGGFEDVIALPGEDLLVGITTDGRIVSINGAGATVDVAELAAIPTRVTSLPLQGRVFLEYPNWRYEVLRGNADSVSTPTYPSTTEPGSLFSERTAGAREDSPSAFARLAEATLSGTSQSDRNTLLDTIERRIDDRSLFGRVEDVVDVLSKLAQESYGGPRIVGGVVQNNFPEIRARATGLLGYFGDRTSRHALATIVRYDPAVEVIAAALHSAGNAGFDDAGVAEWGYQRFRTATDREQRTIAAALISFLSRIVASDQEQANRFTEITARVAASDVSRTVRDQALTLSRRW